MGEDEKYLNVKYRMNRLSEAHEQNQIEIKQLKDEVLNLQKTIKDLKEHQLKCWTAGAKWGRQFYYDKEYICAIDSEEAYEFWKKEMKYEED